MSQRKRTQLEQEVIRAARASVGPRGGYIANSQPLRHAIDALDAHLDEIVNSPGFTGPNSPQTSHDAAAALTPLSGDLRKSIVYALWLDLCDWLDSEHEGLTCEQLETRLAKAHTSTSSAIYYLRLAGWIFDSGRVRSTRAGRSAIVWRLTPAATDWLRQGAT